MWVDQSKMNELKAIRTGMDFVDEFIGEFNAKFPLSKLSEGHMTEMWDKLGELGLSPKQRVDSVKSYYKLKDMV